MTEVDVDVFISAWHIATLRDSIRTIYIKITQCSFLLWPAFGGGGVEVVGVAVGGGRRGEGGGGEVVGVVVGEGDGRGRRRWW